MKSPTSLIRIRNAVGVMLALSAVFAVVISAVTLTPDRALGQTPETVTISLPKKGGEDIDTVREGKKLTFDITLSANTPSGTTLSIPVTVVGTSDDAMSTDHNPVPEDLVADKTTTLEFTAKGDTDREFLESFEVSFGTIVAPAGSEYVYADGSATSFTVKIADANNKSASGKFAITVDKNGVQDETTAPKRGQKLTVDVSGVTDADYTDNAATPNVDESSLSYIASDDNSDPKGEEITYQWKRAGVDIAGETSQSYTPGDADVGEVLSVAVTWSDDLGNGDGKPKEIDAPSFPLKATAYDEAKPFIVVGDLVNGRLTTGVKLTANTSGIVDGDGKAISGITFEWLRDGEAISGATNADYILVPADIGKEITVKATWTDVSEKTATSPPVTPKSLNAPTGKPAITGTAKVGETLTAGTSAIVDKDVLATDTPFTYQWQRDGVNIEGATASTYVLTGDDVDTKISVAVSFVDGAGDTEMVTSDATGLIAAAPTTPGDGGGGGTGGTISRIEPAVRGVTLSAGDKVVLSVLVYGVQKKQDQSLGDGNITWGDASDDTGAEIVYTAPSSPGSHDVKAEVSDAACAATGDAAEIAAACSATIKVQVRRPSAEQPAEEAPENPSGEIPSILADSAGNQYEVFTPVEGGTFSGEGYSLSVAPGAVPNGEFIGIRMSDEGAASNAGMTQQRYTLGGNMYAVSAVDGSGAAVSSYVLDNPATVCVPLPDALRTNISDLAVVALNGNGTLTILSAQVRIDSAGTMVCGGLSSLPATVAVGSAGAPAAIPTAVPEPTPEAPDTGGAAPASSSTVLWALLLGIAVFTLGSALVIARRREGSRRSK